MIDVTHAHPSDLPDIQKMIRALSAYHGDTARVPLAALQDIFFGPVPMGVALMARMGGVPVGYAGLTQMIVLHEGKLKIEIHHLYVCERARSKGVGKALIGAAKAHALAIGATRLIIGADAKNPTAIAAYRAINMLEEITDQGPRFRVNLDN